ncbi:MAG TPA: lysylphosphatidylglycerol synthase transmembrane domain-containing protein [Acidobacteriota bacterium]|nr:lysylphosphatidylglycerol synthase transmembrane domain-containing protein [Acidobacteriota bacterium]
MTSKYQITWKSFLLPIIGLIVFFLYIYIFHVDILQIITIVRGINIYVYLLAAVLVMFDTLFFSLAWYFLLKPLSVKLSLAKALLFVWFGIYIDTLIPAESISGEISKIYLACKEQNGVAGKVTASVIAQRLINMAINIVILLVGATLLLIGGSLYGIMLNLVLLLVAVTFVFLLLILLLLIKEQWTIRVVDAVIMFVERISRGHWKLVRIREEALNEAKAFHSAIREFGHSPRKLILPVSFSLASWIAGPAVFYLSFLSVGYTSIGFGPILVIYAIFTAAKSIPIGVPFEVGLPEITLTTLFIAVSVPPDIAASVTILIRILTLWLRFFIGFGAQQWLGIKAMSTLGSNNRETCAKAEKL